MNVRSSVVVLVGVALIALLAVEVSGVTLAGRRELHRSSSQQSRSLSAASDDVPMCTRCGKKVYPQEGVMLNGLTFHKACFKCRSCGVALELKTAQFFENEVYCKVHLPKKTAPNPTPSQPGVPVANTPTSAVPASASASASSANSAVSVGSSFAAVAAAAYDQTKCGRCGKVVYATEMIKAAGRPWHKPCFKCAVCNQPLSLRDHRAFDGDVYCAVHTPADKKPAPSNPTTPPAGTPAPGTSANTPTSAAAPSVGMALSTMNAK